MKKLLTVLLVLILVFGIAVNNAYALPAGSMAVEAVESDYVLVGKTSDNYVITINPVGSCRSTNCIIVNIYDYNNTLKYTKTHNLGGGYSYSIESIGFSRYSSEYWYITVKENRNTYYMVFDKYGNALTGLQLFHYDMVILDVLPDYSAFGYCQSDATHYLYFKKYGVTTPYYIAQISVGWVGDNRYGITYYAGNKIYVSGNNVICAVNNYAGNTGNFLFDLNIVRAVLMNPTEAQLSDYGPIQTIDNRSWSPARNSMSNGVSITSNCLAKNDVAFVQYSKLSGNLVEINKKVFMSTYYNTANGTKFGYIYLPSLVDLVTPIYTEITDTSAKIDLDEGLYSSGFSYLVEYRRDGETNWSSLSSDYLKPPFIFNNLLPDTNYQFRVTSDFAELAGVSGYSPHYSFMPVGSYFSFRTKTSLQVDIEEILKTDASGNPVNTVIVKEVSGKNYIDVGKTFDNMFNKVDAVRTQAVSATNEAIAAKNDANYIRSTMLSTAGGIVQDGSGTVLTASRDAIAKAEAARAQAVSATTEATSAKTNASTAATNAANAKTSADSAKSEATAAKNILSDSTKGLSKTFDKAEAARAQAASATTEATAAKTNAANAKASADAAKTQATNAATDANYVRNTMLSTAGGIVQDASGTVLSASRDAITKAEAARAQAVSATTQASTAATNAANAKSSADAATNKAEAARLQAVSATNEATAAKTNAATAATNAANAKASADTAATNASQAKTAADTAAANATGAKTSADTAATNASQAKTSADTAATNASQAKSAANTAATNASNAKTAADAAKIAAEQARDRIAPVITKLQGQGGATATRSTSFVVIVTSVPSSGVTYSATCTGPSSANVSVSGNRITFTNLTGAGAYTATVTATLGSASSQESITFFKI